MTPSSPRLPPASPALSTLSDPVPSLLALEVTPKRRAGFVGNCFVVVCCVETKTCWLVNLVERNEQFKCRVFFKDLWDKEMKTNKEGCWLSIMLQDG